MFQWTLQPTLWGGDTLPYHGSTVCMVVGISQPQLQCQKMNLDTSGAGCLRGLAVPHGPPALPWGCVCRVPSWDSTYLCHTLATQLLGMRHSLPDTLDATNHHSPSLQGRGQDVLRLLGARKGLPMATGDGCQHCWPAVPSHCGELTQRGR